MVPIPDRAPKRRYLDPNISQHGSSSGLFSHASGPAPKVTYGKSDNRPLSLTGTQFRKDVYVISSDEEEESDSEGHSSSDVLLQSVARDEDSELSDAEQTSSHEPTRNERNARHEVQSVFANESASFSRATVPTSTAWTKKGTARQLPAPKPRPVFPPEEPTLRKAKRRATAGKPTGARKGSDKPTETELTTTPRRLPVDELFLVTSPLHYNDQPPRSSYQGVQADDPIEERGASQHKRRVSSISTYSDGSISASRVPISVFRKRRRTPDARFKSVVDLRKRQSRRTIASSKTSAEASGGDGFERSELVIGPPLKVKKRRKKVTTLIASFGSLQLRSGPLPDVDFELTSTELAIETQPNEDDIYLANDNRDSVEPVQAAQSSEHSSKRRVSFRAAARESLIQAQLSSISAPERTLSDSEESEDDEDDDVIAHEDNSEEQTDGELEHEIGQRGKNDLGPKRRPSPMIASELVESEHSAKQKRRRIEQPDDMNQVVTLDFRKIAVPGEYPRRALGKPSLIEVNEAIVEVPESDHLPTNYVLSGPGMSENEANRRARPLPRPRSILKNSTQVVPESTTRAEATESNTRRNSIVEITESRDFTGAADSLRRPDPTTHRIIPRRSSYFDQSNIEVIDSDRRIPETSPESPSYGNTSDLNVLRRTSEAVWTSSSDLPTVPRDLKALTRSVSRENGTLSQAVRRRSSLPFQSPTKAQ